MIDLPLNRLQPGMVMAQSVLNSSGASYLSRGQKLTTGYIERLRQMGVRAIHVSSTMTSGPKVPLPEDVLEERTRAIAVKRVYDMFQQINEKKTFDPVPLGKASESILNDIMTRKGNLVQLTDLRVHDMYTFAHSVNVAMLSSLLGVLCGLSKEQLSELTLGTMMHDLGKISIAKEILNKPGRLDDEEFNIIKRHPVEGSNLIRSMPLPNAKQLSIVARQHHEHMDGKGYPDHRKGDQIHIYGRIAAIADVYDALTSVRPYKKAYAPSVAYHIMKNCSAGHFDEDLLRMFFSNVAIYPVGTVLNTTAGYGIVRKVEFGKTDRPVVCIFADKAFRLLKKAFDIDFSTTSKDTIDKVLNDTELLHFIHEMKFDPAVLLLEDGK
ncbi:MAG: HD-GYP domain-containing protein [Selenomonadaceae bacterium]|nr:HD-GYP domain-containing protein [Selenomonadaceae bacterium]MBQ3972391.1 HD-GYP domain-containing protein [Selenomonadaceae bacterium]